MLEAKREKLFDVTYFITPTFDSNKAHWSQFNISENNVFYPNRDAIQKVIKRIEQDRDEFENYLVEMKKACSDKHLPSQRCQNCTAV